MFKSVRGVADEIIVVDTGSTDSTLQIALSFGAKVVHHPWNGDFAAARNAGLQQARGQWILILDGDEELDAKSKGSCCCVRSIWSMKLFSAHS